MLPLDKADLQVLRELSRYFTPKDYQRHGEEAYYVLRKLVGLRVWVVAEGFLWLLTN